MTVKDRVGRVRYVAFRVEPSVGRPAMSDAMPEGAKLTRFDGTFGIARTSHARAAEVRVALAAVSRAGGRDVLVATLGTSGTLKAVARRFPPGAKAGERGPRPPRPEGKS